MIVIIYSKPTRVRLLSISGSFARWPLCLYLCVRVCGCDHQSSHKNKFNLNERERAPFLWSPIARKRDDHMSKRMDDRYTLHVLPYIEFVRIQPIKLASIFSLFRSLNAR